MNTQTTERTRTVRYEVKRSPAGVSLWRFTNTGQKSEITPAESQKVRNHSPDGFEFGYGGSGPAQLALAILLDYAGLEEAQHSYQDFKFKFISMMPVEGGTITTDQIFNWLEARAQ